LLLMVSILAGLVIWRNYIWTASLN